MGKFTEKDRTHVLTICRRFAEEATRKYVAGVREHGGHLPDKPGMLANLRAEVLDLAIYQDTLTDQLRRVLALMDEARYAEARTSLAAVLGPSID